MIRCRYSNSPIFSCQFSVLLTVYYRDKIPAVNNKKRMISLDSQFQRCHSSYVWLHFYNETEQHTGDNVVKIIVEQSSLLHHIQEATKEWWPGDNYTFKSMFSVIYFPELSHTCYFFDFPKLTLNYEFNNGLCHLIVHDLITSLNTHHWTLNWEAIIQHMTFGGCFIVKP